MYYKFMKKLNLLPIWYGNLALVVLEVTLVICFVKFCNLPKNFVLLLTLPFIVRGYCYRYGKNYEGYKLHSQTERIGRDTEEKLRHSNMEMCLLNIENKVSCKTSKVLTNISLTLMIIGTLVVIGMGLSDRILLNDYQRNVILYCVSCTYVLFVGWQIMLIFDLVKRFKDLET